MNKAYEARFKGTAMPSRSCIGVQELPMGTDVEIECTAVVPDSGSKL